MSQSKKIVKSVIDKWLHEENGYSKQEIRALLKLGVVEYEHYLERPRDYFTVAQMEKIAVLVNRNIAEVFFGCYKRPIGEIINDPKKIETNQALDRLFKKPSQPRK